MLPDDELSSFSSLCKVQMWIQSMEIGITYVLNAEMPYALSTTGNPTPAAS